MRIMGFCIFILLASCQIEIPIQICNDFDVELETNLGTELFFEVPNIIADSADGNAIFSTKITTVDGSSIEQEIGVPINIQIEVSNEAQDIALTSTAITYDSMHSIYHLWDGYIDGAFNSGIYNYSIQFEWPDNKYLNIDGQVRALSCEDYNTLIQKSDSIIYYDFSNCKWHLGVVYRPHEYPNPGSFCN